MSIYALGHHQPDIHPTAYVHPDATVIGRVSIGAESSVWPQAVIRADDGPITIGERTSVQDGSVLHVTSAHATVLGDDVVVGHLVHLEGCTIEDRSLCGNGSVILHGCVVRHDALVGSNAVLPDGVEVPPGAMALGVPAVIKPDRLQRGVVEHIAASYVERSALYRSGLRRLD